MAVTFPRRKAASGRIPPCVEARHVRPSSGAVVPLTSFKVRDAALSTQRRVLLIDDDAEVRAWALEHLGVQACYLSAVSFGPDLWLQRRRRPDDLVVLGGVTEARADLSCELRRAFGAPVVPLFRPSVYMRPRLMGLDRDARLVLGLVDCGHRISHHLRGCDRPSEILVRWGDFTLRLEAGGFAFRGQDLELTRVQSAILSLFMRHSGEVVSKALIEAQVFRDKPRSQTNFIPVHISRLRARLRDMRSDMFIENIRGAGYVLFWNRSFVPGGIPEPEVLRHGMSQGITAY